MACSLYIMERTILYIDAGLDISPVNIYDATDYIYVSEKNLFDDFTTIMQKHDWKMHTSAIYYNNIFCAEYYKEDKKLIYFFNINFPNDLHTITKNRKYSIILVHNQSYMDYILECFPNLSNKLICI